MSKLRYYFSLNHGQIVTIMLKPYNQKAVINRQPLFSFRNYGPENTGRKLNLHNGVIMSRL